jgi:hypothetical protein
VRKAPWQSSSAGVRQNCVEASQAVSFRPLITVVNLLATPQGAV